MYDKKTLLHAKRWYVYVNKMENIIIRVGIWWKLSVLTGRRLFVKWFMIML